MMLAVLASDRRWDFLSLCLRITHLALPTRVVFVASSLEETTTGKENQQDYYCEQGNRWEDGHHKSLRPETRAKQSGV